MNSRQRQFQRTTLSDLRSDNRNSAVIEVVVPHDIFRKAIEKEQQAMGALQQHKASAVGNSSNVSNMHDDSYDTSSLSGDENVDDNDAQNDAERVRELMRGTFLTEAYLQEAVAPKDALDDPNTYIYTLAKNIRAQQTAQEEAVRKENNTKHSTERSKMQTQKPEETAATDARHINTMLNKLAPQIASAQMTRQQYVERIFGREKLKSLRQEHGTDMTLVYGDKIGRYQRSIPLDAWQNTFLLWQKEHIFDKIDPQDPQQLRDMLQANLTKSINATRADQKGNRQKGRRRSVVHTNIASSAADGGKSPAATGGSRAATRPPTQQSAVREQDDSNLLTRTPLYLQTDRPDFMLYRSRSRLNYMGEKRDFSRSATPGPDAQRDREQPQRRTVQSSLGQADIERKRPRTSIGGSQFASKRPAREADKAGQVRAATTLGFHSSADRPSSPQWLQRQEQPRSSSSFGMTRKPDTWKLGTSVIEEKSGFLERSSDSRAASRLSIVTTHSEAATAVNQSTQPEPQRHVDPVTAAAGRSIPLMVRRKETKHESSSQPSSAPGSPTGSDINPFSSDAYESSITFLTEVTEEPPKPESHNSSQPPVQQMRVPSEKSTPHSSGNQGSRFQNLVSSNLAGDSYSGFDSMFITQLKKAHEEEVIQAEQEQQQPPKPLMKRLDAAMQMAESQAILSDDLNSLKESMENAVQQVEAIEAGSVIDINEPSKKKLRNAVRKGGDTSGMALNFPIEEIILSKKRIDKVKRGNSFVSDMGSIPNPDELFPPVRLRRNRTQSLANYAHVSNMSIRDSPGAASFINPSGQSQLKLDQIMRSMQSKKESRLEALDKKLRAEIDGRFDSESEAALRPNTATSVSAGEAATEDFDINKLRRKGDYKWLETLVDEDPKLDPVSHEDCNGVLQTGRSISPKRKGVKNMRSANHLLQYKKLEETNKQLANIISQRSEQNCERILRNWKDNFAHQKIAMHVDLLDKLDQRQIDRLLVYRSKDHLEHVARHAMRSAKDWTYYRLLSKPPNDNKRDQPATDGIDPAATQHTDVSESKTSLDNSQLGVRKTEDQQPAQATENIWTERRSILLQQEELLVESYVFYHKFLGFLSLINAPSQQIQMDIIEFVRQSLIRDHKVSQQILFDLLETFQQKALSGREVLRILTFLVVALKVDMKRLERMLKKRNWLNTEEVRFFLEKAAEAQSAGTGTPASPSHP